MRNLSPQQQASRHINVVDHVAPTDQVRLRFVAGWGPCLDCGGRPADLDGDCTVGVLDLLLVLTNWS